MYSQFMMHGQKKTLRQGYLYSPENRDEFLQ